MVYAPPIQTKGHTSRPPARQSGLVSSRDQGLQYDGDNVVGDLQNGSMARFYVTPFLDQNLSMTVVGGPQAGIYYYSQDGLGSVRTLTNSSGNIANHYDYDAFGVPQALGTNEGVDQRYTYTGRESSGVSGGPMYYRNRTVFNGLGRFGRRDPAGYPNNEFGNLYGYVGNRPNLYIDPIGLGHKKIYDKDVSVGDASVTVRVYFDVQKGIHGVKVLSYDYDCVKCDLLSFVYRTIKEPNESGRLSEQTIETKGGKKYKTTTDVDNPNLTVDTTAERGEEPRLDKGAKGKARVEYGKDSNKRGNKYTYLWHVDKPSFDRGFGTDQTWNATIYLLCEIDGKQQPVHKISISHTLEGKTGARRFPSPTGQDTKSFTEAETNTLKNEGYKYPTGSAAQQVITP